MVDYVKATINSWYWKLSNDISYCNTNEEVETIITKANASIEADLKVVTEKIKKSDASTSASDQIISTTEWAKNVALEGSNQLKVIGVQIAAGSTTAKDSIAGLIESTEKQISVAYDKCDSSLTIEVDHAKISPEHVTKVVKHDAKKTKAKKEQKKVMIDSVDIKETTKWKHSMEILKINNNYYRPKRKRNVHASLNKRILNVNQNLRLLNTLLKVLWLLALLLVLLQPSVSRRKSHLKRRK